MNKKDAGGGGGGWKGGRGALETGISIKDLVRDNGMEVGKDRTNNVESKKDKTETNKRNN